MTADAPATTRRSNSPRKHPKAAAAPAHQNAGGSSSSGDAYYGHEAMAKMAAAFITSLFSCPELPPPTTVLTVSGQPLPSPKLAHFVAYALHRTRLASSVTFAALFLLQRLKLRFPAARGSSGHRLFISAFMIASKVVCDDTYSNKSWCVVGQGMFSLREINQMEREMCGYLEWVLNVQHLELETFTEMVQDKFSVSPGSTVASTAAAAKKLAAPTPPVKEIVVATPTFNPPPSTSPIYDPMNYPSPDSRHASPGSEPESPSHSDTTSPASSAPQTPPSNDGDSDPVVHHDPRVVGVGSSFAKMSSIPSDQKVSVAAGGIPTTTSFAGAVW